VSSMSASTTSATPKIEDEHLELLAVAELLKKVA
jgi:hypothetical protein